MPRYSPLTAADLETLRQEGDPAARRAIEDIYRLGGDAREALRAALAALESNQDPLPMAGVPDSLARLWCDAAQAGTAAGGWDQEEMDRGARFFEEYGMQVPMILHLLSLPLTYAASQGVRVLGVTAQMQKNPLRRILGTAQMVLDVMSEDGFAQAGRGRASAFKVRLWHEVVRQQIERGQRDRWDPRERPAGRPDGPALGVPINQEDLLGTLMAFSVVVLRGLRLLGASFTDVEAQSYYHRWTAVAVVLGLRRELIPETLEEAERVFCLIQDRNYLPDNRVGVQVTRALLDMLTAVIPAHLMAEHMVPAMMRYLLQGERLPVAQLLEVPEAGRVSQEIIHLLSKVFGGLDRTWDEHERMRRHLEQVSMYLLHRTLVEERGTEQHERWTLPPTLQECWGIHDIHAPRQAPFGRLLRKRQEPAGPQADLASCG